MEVKDTNSEKIILYLFNYLDSYDEIKALVNNLNLDISNLFLPNSLIALDKILEDNEKLCLQLINFMDVVKFYSLLLYNDESYFTTKIKKIIVSNRVLNSNVNIIGKKSFNSILFDSEGGLNDLLDNNISLLSLYTFLVLKQIQST